MTSYEQMAQTPLGDNILAQIAATARDIIAARQLVLQKEEELKAAKYQLEFLQREVLPELMKDAGQKELITSDGLKVSIKQLVRGQPSKENEAAAFAWLRDHGHGGIIKSQVTADLGKVDQQRVNDAVNALSQLGFTASAKQAVAWQTLGALVRELLAQGENVPLDILGVSVWEEAEVKPKS
jgi:hypothetical protein